ncbi:acyltransferase family protein [Kitasatospora sp. HPMI-4]|uniref:acyltransferase family protein n=1 Tax=Kitasatospora sp. HPMI-4 TaxID=3448443 RepID=UPI003F1E43A4
MTAIEQQRASTVDGTGESPVSQPALRMGWLDALRGVAALLVAVHHFGLIHLIPYGGTINREFDLGIYAVMLFFLVSGYIVPASLERRGDVRGFWIGRIFRIYPLLIVVITAALLILPKAQSAVPDVVRNAPVQSAVANGLLLHEMLNVPSALGAMWTLCYEMVFYFFVGALFVQNRHRLSAPIAAAFAALALLLGGVVPSAMITTDEGSTLNMIAATAVVMVAGLVCVLTGRAALVRIGSLVLGGLGAVLLFLNARSTFFESMTILATMFAGTVIHRVERGQTARRWGLVCCGSVLVCGVLVGFLYDHGDAFYRTWTTSWVGFSLPYAAAWATFGLGMLLRDRRFPRVLTWLGAISYSVYVVHIPVLHAVRWLLPDDAFPHHGPGKFGPSLVFLAAVLLLSHLTYRLVELPGQNLGRRLLKSLNARPARSGI